jgi:hypothetical protein
MDIQEQLQQLLRDVTGEKTVTVEIPKEKNAWRLFFECGFGVV